MSKVFKVWPKRVKRVNGTVLTPEMVIIVTIPMHVSNPFGNGAKEIKESISSTTRKPTAINRISILLHWINFVFKSKMKYFSFAFSIPLIWKT